MKKIKLLLTACLLCTLSLDATTIAEKKLKLSRGSQGLTPELENMLRLVNKEIAHEQFQLQELYIQAQTLHNNKADENCYKELLNQINEKKRRLFELKNGWREAYTQLKGQSDQYALWQQTDATLEQLIIDYGAMDYVYLIPPEIGEIRVSLSSQILIPRASFGEMLQIVLKQNGVGIRELNPFLRELYFTEYDASNIELITNNVEEINFYDDTAHICFMLNPEPQDLKRTWFFLKKFSNWRTMNMELIGRHILIIGEVRHIKELLKVHSFISKNKGALEYKAIPLYRTQPREIADALELIFSQMVDNIECETIADPCTQSGLKVVVLSDTAQSLFLIGTKQELCKAEEIINRIEAQVGMARDKVVYQYRTKHSDPEELAQILERVYYMMLETNVLYLDGQMVANINRDGGTEVDASASSASKNVIVQNNPFPQPDPSRIYRENFYQQGGYIINPRPIEPGEPFPKETNKDRANFIVDVKTGSIVMVIEADILPKLKELIRCLDVPKTMVQIEVMLFEKRLRRENAYGLNLLKIGTKASQQRISSICWNDIASNPLNLGILEFFFSRPKTDKHPAFDVAYKFLLSQDDVYINATPSVTTVNQTPATIAIADEISINTGTFAIPTEGTVSLKDSFTRAQYGITIQVTPTVHLHDQEELYTDPTDYVTLSSDITFDTILPGSIDKNRPDVNRRHLVNELRIPDGQSVIMGGLRRKNTSDAKDAIPLIGEFPYIGKLFSINEMKDENTEMFILMTPKIIRDPVDEWKHLRCLELSKRPGDIPDFLCALNKALDHEKNRFLQGTFTMLFGRPQDRCLTSYD